MSTQADFLQVKNRVMHSGPCKKTIPIMIGMALQLLWLASILLGCWFVQSAGIVAFWCTVCWTCHLGQPH